MLLPAFTSTSRHDTQALENRVLCCDALDLLRALPDASIDMVLCDLPYGITACVWDSIIPIEPLWVELKRVVKRRAAIVLTATQPFTSMLVSSNYEMFRHEWIWDKYIARGLQTARYKPMQRHESVLIFSQDTLNYYPIMKKRDNPVSGKIYALSDVSRITNKDDKLRTYTHKFPQSIIEFSNHNSITGSIHPTQKPVALFEYLIKTYTQEGELVLDMTCGSGTTALSCIRTGRRFICGDLSPEYVALAKQRLEATDPYQHTTLPDGTKQLSLFAE
jgi:site-specific DNA-methyltransferase (adenine-specific)